MTGDIAPMTSASPTPSGWAPSAAARLTPLGGLLGAGRLGPPEKTRSHWIAFVGPKDSASITGRAHASSSSRPLLST